MVAVSFTETAPAARPVHFDIFPSRGCDESAFSKSLKPALSKFEALHRPPIAKIDGKTGAYSFAEP